MAGEEDAPEPRDADRGAGRADARRHERGHPCGRGDAEATHRNDQAVRRLRLDPGQDCPTRRHESARRVQAGDEVQDGRPAAPDEPLLDQHDEPWLEGRLWGLAEEISETFHETARCTRYVNAIARGKKRFTPKNVDELRRLVEEDLMLHQAAMPGSYRDAYDRISRGLDVPSKVTTTVSASVRRALAHQIQRDRLRGDA